MAVTEFGRPIPGNSLTTHKPGDRPWERPPEMATVEDTLKFYVKRISNQDVIDDLIVALDSGIPLNPLVKTMYTSGVMNGMHSLDVGLLIAPALTEYLAAIAKSYDIDFKFSAVDPKEEMDAKERARISMMINAAIEKGIEVGGEEDEGVQLLSQMAATLDAEMSTEEIEEELSDAEGEQEEEPMMQEEDEQQEAPTGGLMAREGM
tara:strand:- start:3577 stop:4194 length:618 start_codon:yes stop_codon:yes gene_type:complete